MEDVRALRRRAARPTTSRAPTIRDVAAAAGVSHQTVANVLRAPDRVAPATRQRVEEHINRLGFRPNRLAQNLSHRRSRLIAFRATVSGGGGAVHDEFLHALTEGAEAIDHHIVLFHSDPGLAEVAKAAQLARDQVADAFILANTHPGDRRLPALVEAGLVFVTFGRTDADVPHHWVDTDNIAGGRMVGEHLLATGHRDVAFVGWPKGSWAGDDRLDGVRSALTAADANLVDARVVSVANDRRAAESAVAELLDREPDVSAIACASDELAVGAIVAAARHRHPISVAGYDDSALAATATPFTSVRQPMSEIAARILHILTRTLAGEQLEPIHERIAPRLVVRGAPPDR